LGRLQGVTKKLLRVFTPKKKNLATMIRRDPNYYNMTPNQLLGEILHQELVDQMWRSHLP
jgi:hypothetical protein